MSEPGGWVFAVLFLLAVCCTSECAPEPGSILDRALPQVTCDE